MPASRYPTNGGKRSRTASNPPTNANARLTAMVAISGTSWVVIAANTQTNRTAAREMREHRYRARAIGYAKSSHLKRTS
jgi:hypothetical protein